MCQFNKAAQKCPHCGTVQTDENSSRRLSGPYVGHFVGYCRACKKASDKIRYQNNRERLLKQTRQWVIDNPEKRVSYATRYRKENRERIRQYFLSRRKTDPRYKLTLSLRKRLWNALRGSGRKSDKTLNLLGCPVAWLEVHLESLFKPGMTWENYGNRWHVDHKRPCASFDLTNPAHQQICFHWTNLQPLFAEENMKKGARLG